MNRPPCAYRAAQSFPSEKYLGKHSDSAMQPALNRRRERQRKVRPYIQGFIALLAIITLAAGFYAIYSETVNDILGGLIR